MHHIVTTPRILYQSAFLDRHLHLIFKYKKLKTYTVDRAVTGKTLYFCYLTYGSWTVTGKTLYISYLTYSSRAVNETDSPYQTVTG